MKSVMNYISAMAALLRFEGTLFSEKISLKYLQYYCALNVTVLGLIYGASACYFSEGVFAQKGVDDASYSVVKIIMTGVPVAFLMHAGAALFIWVFLRGIGGKASFLSSYFYIGIAAISLWPLAPFLAAIQIQVTGSHKLLVTISGALFALYGFAVNYQVIQKVYQLSRIKMAIATTVTIVYIGCFLYLWT